MNWKTQIFWIGHYEQVNDEEIFKTTSARIKTTKDGVVIEDYEKSCIGSITVTREKIDSKILSKF